MTDYSGLLNELRSCGGGICPANCQFFDLSESGHNCEGVLMAVAADTIEELQDTVQAQDKALKLCADQLIRHWTPVAARLPEKSGNYIVNIVCPKGKWVEVNCFYADSKDWMTIDDYAEFSTKYVTHWMPLPPPKGEE